MLFRNVGNYSIIYTTSYLKRHHRCEIIKSRPQIHSLPTRSVFKEMEGRAGIVRAVYQLVPRIVRAVYQLVPGIVRAVYQLVPGIVRVVYQLVPGILRAVYQLVPGILRAVYQLVPGIVRAVYQLQTPREREALFETINF
jgi:predicted GTPase